MNYRLIFRLIGNMLRIEAVFMLLPLAVSLIYGGGEHWAFLWPLSLLGITGSLLSACKPGEKVFRTKDAFTTAGLSWLFMSLFGALPYYFSGCFDSFIDCVFESISGFTTTGSSILENVEHLPEGILIWRSFSQWIGGIGVLVFLLAVVPSMNASSVNLLRAESTGPSPDKIVPKIRETAKIMCLIYLAMTGLLVILLCVTGLPLFDALLHAFSTAGTGGFSNRNASIGAYGNMAAEIVIMIFMFLFGISFSLYFILLGGRIRKFFGDEELKLYFGLTAAAVLMIAVNVLKEYGSFAEALRHSAFQVLAIISSTGFTTADYSHWPALSQTVLVFLMVTGSCAGSTGGGLKLIRLLLLLKTARIEMGRILHPGSIKAVTVNQKKISQDIMTKTALFFFIYFVLFFSSVVLVSFEGRDIVTSTTAVIASLSNIGPGLGEIGPSGSYSAFSPFSKAVLSFCMVAGRLEFLPMLVLFMPSVWKKRR